MAFRLASTSVRNVSRSLGTKPAASAPAFAWNQRRLVSHYSVSLAGLTEEQAEVRAARLLYDLKLIVYSCSIVPGGRSPVR